MDGNALFSDSLVRIFSQVSLEFYDLQVVGTVSALFKLNVVKKPKKMLSAQHIALWLVLVKERMTSLNLMK
jgi:hypothetical protein